MPSLSVLAIGGLFSLLVRVAMPMCAPTDYTLYIEKPECDFCVAVNTTICVGFCFSWDRNIEELYGPRFLIQKGCTYQEVEYRTAVLPGCPPHADPTFTYPVALRCNCSTCNTHSDECAHKTPSGSPTAKCSKPVRHLHPFVGESDYFQSLWDGQLL